MFCDILSASDERKFVESEFERLGFVQEPKWRISVINENFEFCGTYPRYLIFPTSFEDKDLNAVAKFRFTQRVPTATWRYPKNGCFIIRSSQPTVGWFGWYRDEFDELLIKKYIEIISSQSSTIETNDNEAPKNEQVKHDKQAIQDSDSKLKIGDNGTKRMLGNIQGLEKIIVETTSAEPINTATTDHQDDNSIDKEKHGVIDTSSDVDVTHNKQPTTNLNSEETSSNHSTQIADDTQLDKPLTLPATVNGFLTSSFDFADSLSAANDLMTSFLGANLLPSANIMTAFSPLIATKPTTATKLLIYDARSYAAATANRAKGGGCECSEYYPGCEILFMNLPNIHCIRKSFQSLKSVCEAYSEQTSKWMGPLENSKWLHYLSFLLKAAVMVVDTIDVDGRSVLIHCSDGWDRTPQLSCLTQIMLDPYYRTFKGFKTLVQKEWLNFGHKFADRCGNNPGTDDPNERCPVFLQWLDCVHQLLLQFPHSFEFNPSYLHKLNRHTYSNVFGTFSYNCLQERYLGRLTDRTFSVWSYLDSAESRYRNETYSGDSSALRPACQIRDLVFWAEMYLSPLKNHETSTPVLSSSFENSKKFYDSLIMEEPPQTPCQ